MKIYLAWIDLGFWREDFYELVKAETKKEAYDKVWERYPKAKEVEIDEPIE